MKNIEFKPVIALVTVSALIGVVIEYFAGFSWLTAALIVMIAFLINGLAIFSEDLEPSSGFDYQKGITDTPKAKKEQKKAMRIQGVIIVALIVCAIWSYTVAV